jgi:hypothetical protein
VLSAVRRYRPHHPGHLLCDGIYQAPRERPP